MRAKRYRSADAIEILTRKKPGWNSRVSQYCGRFEFIDNGDDNLVPYFQMTVPERYLRKSEDLDDLITRVVQTASIREDEIRLMTYRKEVGPSRIEDLCKLISGRMAAGDNS